MSEPLVSIIIPVYNAEKYLAETIKSALGQTWPNKEIIIVDDESTDNSLAVARSFKSNLITIISQKNSGASVARNSGLNIARGKYIQFLDADDIISADKIASQLTILNNLDTHLTVCSTIHFKTGDDYNNLPITHEWFEEGSDDPVDFLLKLYAGKEVMPGYGGMIQPNAWLTPKKLIDKAGPWNEFRCPDDDGEFFCRVILAGQGVKFSSNGINYYRKHDTGNSLSAQKSREAMQNKLLAIDLKYSHLKNRPNTEQLDAIFAMHYWGFGVAAYPRYKDLSYRAITMAKQFGYSGEKYGGGKRGKIVSKFFGWRLARIILFYYTKFNK